jgi:hypothetical protein
LPVPKQHSQIAALGSNILEHFSRWRTHCMPDASKIPWAILLSRLTDVFSRCLIIHSKLVFNWQIL